MTEADANVGKYSISVASELTGVPEHKLRAFESASILDPERTEGGTRRYSDADLALIRRAAELSDQGVNYAGILVILQLEAQGQTATSEENDNQQNESTTATEDSA